MVLYARKVKTDNGFGYSHLEFTRNINEGVDYSIHQGFGKGGLSLEEREAVEVFRSSPDPKGYAFTDNGVHVPGTGYCPGDWSRIV